MSLTKTQKKYLKKNIRQLALGQIAIDLEVDEKEILNFLKSHWRKEKYEKFIAQQKRLEQYTSERGPAQRGLLRGEINLKAWLKRNKLVLLFLTFLVLVVYFNSLGNDFVSDDIAAIKDNPNIGKTSLLWQPPYFNINLRLLVIFLTHKIFGLNPLFYRLSNVLFHLGSTWAIFLLIGFFLSSPIPLITAGLFAVHPLLTEPVTWISGGPYSNGAFFFLLAFLTYIQATNRKKSKLYLASIFLFYLALLFSEKLIVFPFVLLLYELCWGSIKDHWKKLTPFWLIAGFWGLRLFGLVGARIASLETIHSQKPTIYNPFIQVPIAIVSYLKLIFWPKSLTLYHSEMSFSQMGYLLRLGVFIIFLTAIAYFFKKDRRIFFWLSFFIISLLPTLTPLGISWIVAERYVYLGSIGIFVIIAMGIQKIGNRISYPLFAIILILLSTRTIIRNKDWKNQDTLWLATAETSPSSPQNHNNLGDYYGRQGNLKRSVEEFEKAIELKPGYADAFHNLANTYQQMNETEKAIINYQKALEFNPNLWQSHQNLAAIYFNQEKFDLAKEEFKKAIEINQENSNLYANLGLVYLKLNEKGNAQEALQQALQLDPENQQALQLLSD